MGRKSNETIEAENRAAEARFNESVSSKVAEMLPGLIGQIMGQLGAAARPAVAALDEDLDIRDMSHPSTPDGTKAFASALGLAIANLSAQGTGKQELVPPEILEARANARGRMMQLLVKARAENNLPTYRVLKPCYFNSTKIEPQWHDNVTKAMKDTEIYWDEVPNEDLEPTNEMAVQVFTEFLNSIGEAPKKRNEPAEVWVRSENRLYKGMTTEQRAQVYGSSTDIRIEGKGAPTTGKREHILGTVTAPAVVR